MSADKETFTFTWKIENFSMCPQKCGEYLSSPVFEVYKLENTEWRLVLYPRGRNTKDILSVFLHRKRTGRYSGDIEIGFEFIVFSGDATKYRKFLQPRQIFGSKSGYGWDNLISRDTVWTLRNDYLPNDILTIKCSIWRVGKALEITEPEDSDIVCQNPNDFETILSMEMFNNATAEMLDFKEQLSSKNVSSRTIIVVRKRVVTWPIRKFSSLGISHRFSMPVISPLVDVPSFLLTFYLSDISDGEQYAQVEIRRKDTDCSRQTFVNLKVSVQNTLVNDQYFVEEEHFFDPGVVDDIWKLTSFIRPKHLEDQKYFETNNDILILRCEFSISQLGDICHTEDVDIIPSADPALSWSNIPNPFEKEFKHFYKDGELWDVALRAGNRVFKVHKVILSARSSFFRGMFLGEVQREIVDIPDLNPDTMDRVLVYLYTDALDDMKPKDVIELYSAAETCKILCLKLRCRCILKSMLTVSNMCGILILADLHQDVDLMDAIQSFITVNSREVFQSPEWKHLMKSNGTLASDVMYGMLVKSTEGIEESLSNTKKEEE